MSTFDREEFRNGMLRIFLEDLELSGAWQPPAGETIDDVVSRIDWHPDQTPAIDQARAHELFRDAIAKHPGGQAGWSRDNGFSPSFVNDILHGRREISQPIAEALGLQRTTIFVRNEPVT